MDENEIRNRFFETTDGERADVDVSASVRAGIWNFLKGVPEGTTVGRVIESLEGDMG